MTLSFRRTGMGILMVMVLLAVALVCSALFANEAHAASKGWKLVNGGKDLVYVEKGGKKAVSKVINGITINSKGYAVKDYAGKLKILIMKRIKQLTKPGMSRKEKLRKCFNWCDNASYHNVEPSDYGSTGWVQRHAYNYIATHRGECMGFACAMAMFAYELGYKPTVQTVPHNHSWTVVNHRSLDYLGSRFFGAVRHISGQKSWKITSWSSHTPKGTSVLAQTAQRKSGLFKLKGNYYYSKDKKMVRNSWITTEGERYYFGSDGKAYRGCKKIKSSYYVFDTKGQLCQGSDTQMVKVRGVTYRVAKNGKCAAGWNKSKTAYYLANGTRAKGVCCIAGKISVFSAKGVYSKAKTAAARAEMEVGGPAEELLSTLGEPQGKRVIGSSCYTVPSNPGLRGNDVAYYYDHAILNIFVGTDGRMYLESVNVC